MHNLIIKFYTFVYEKVHKTKDIACENTNLN